MTTYAELIDYFETIPTAIPGVKQVTIGSDEEELSLQSNSIRYPHLRVDTPTLSFINEDENPITRYTFQIALLKNVTEKTRKAENAVLSEMEVLLRSVYHKIVADAEPLNAGFDLVLGARESNPIRRFSGDNAFGWVMNITIELYTATC